MYEKMKIDIERGKVGEEVVYNILMDNIDTKHLVDVREDSLFQRLDIDFLQVTNKNKVRKIEVKTDAIVHKTGNIVYEYFSDITAGTKGCFEKTESDFIFYYLTYVEELYIINTKKLKSYVNKNIRLLKEANMGDNAWGFLIKIEDLVENNIALYKGTYKRELI